MKIGKGVEIVDLALFMPEDGVLVISDLHIGYEDALVKQGVQIPKFHFKDLVDRLEGILDRVSGQVKLVVVCGDLKHEFGRISDEEWRNTLKLLDLLLRKCGKVVLIEGNHDKVLGPIADKRDVEVVGTLLLGDVMFVHGDEIVDVPASVKTLVIGHEHPAVTLQDGVRRETYKCFLSGKWKGKNLIVLPSMKLVTEGSDVASEKMLSPYLKGDISQFLVYVVGDKVYEFGSVESLR